ncbi:hypothetical protein ACTXT7_003021 [Hymenolepis weldensis]
MSLQLRGRKTETSVMCRRRNLGVLTDICLGIYVQTRKHTARPPVDTVVVDLRYATIFTPHKDPEI